MKLLFIGLSVFLFNLESYAFVQILGKSKYFTKTCASSHSEFCFKTFFIQKGKSEVLKLQKDLELPKRESPEKAYNHSISDLISGGLDFDGRIEFQGAGNIPSFTSHDNMVVIQCTDPQKWNGEFSETCILRSFNYPFTGHSKNIYSEDFNTDTFKIVLRDQGDAKALYNSLKTPEASSNSGTIRKSLFVPFHHNIMKSFSIKCALLSKKNLYRCEVVWGLTANKLSYYKDKLWVWD